MSDRRELTVRVRACRADNGYVVETDSFHAHRARRRIAADKTALARHLHEAADDLIYEVLDQIDA